MIESVFIFLVLGICLSIGSSMFLYLQGKNATKRNKRISYGIFLLGTGMSIAALFRQTTIPMGDAVLYIFALVGLKTIIGFRFPWEPIAKTKRELKECFESIKTMIPMMTHQELVKKVDSI